MTLYCPNCSSEVVEQAKLCEVCKADFSDPQGWKPTQIPGTWKPVVTRTTAAVGVLSRVLLFLVVGPVLALLVGLGSYFGSELLMVFGVFLGFLLLIWIFAPLAGLGVSKTEADGKQKANEP